MPTPREVVRDALSGVKTTNVGAVFDVVREDVATGTSLSREAALQNAPAVSHDQFRMPKVVD